MPGWGEIASNAVAAIAAVPFAVLVIESLAALLPARRRVRANVRPRAAILIPAHDESAGIAATVATLQTQLSPDDRIVVIADNCTDDTADKARAAGAEAIERHDADRRGKGYALDFGLNHLKADPPGVVIVIDADSGVRSNSVDALARAAASNPVQGTNVLDAPAGSGPGARIASFAFFFKNVIRPRGLDRLGLPCLLYGTGMALPWSAMETINLAHGDITEDIRLGAELAINGTPARFCPDGGVTGELPTAQRIARTQRRRWEHGHLRTLTREAPRLAWHGLTKGRPSLIALALHLGVPPLAFVFMLGAMVTAFLLLLQQWSAASVIAGAMASAVVAILLTWMAFARDRLPPRDLVMLPVYVLGKVPLYLGYLFKPERQWVRTEREETGTAG